jgi:hypothetical protein
VIFGLDKFVRTALRGPRVPNSGSGQLFSHIKGRYINLSNVVTNFMMKINIMLAIYSKYDPFPSA